MTTIVKIHDYLHAPTPHNGRYVVAWDPHTRFGTLAVTSTNDPAKAHRFEDPRQAFEQWRTVSNVERLRPDGELNRPLTGVSVEFLPGEPIEEPATPRGGKS